MEVLKTLVAFVHLSLGFFVQGNADSLIDCKVMFPTFAHMHTDDPFAFAINDDLSLQSMAFLLTRVVFALFFWGRSIGLSPTSITTTS